MKRLDVLIPGAIGMAILGAFLLGLANSIGAVPFWIITVTVLILALIEFFEELTSRPGNNGNNSA